MAKQYTNGEVTVVWKPDLCIHSAKCVQGLGSVFNPEVRPWINMGGATSQEIVEQVAKCPSGALSILKEENTTDRMEPTNQKTAVQVLTDGPVRVAGPCEVAMPDGTTEVREKDIFLCRCGFSSNKPYCDGSHKPQGFKG